MGVGTRVSRWQGVALKTPDAERRNRHPGFQPNKEGGNLDRTDEAESNA